MLEVHDAAGRAGAPGAGPDDLLRVWVEEERDRASPRRRGASRGFEQRAWPRCTPSKTPMRDAAGPIAAEVARSSASGFTPHPWTRRPSPAAACPLPGCRRRAAPPRRRSHDARRRTRLGGVLRRAVEEAARASGSSAQPRQRQQRRHRQDGLGQATLAGAAPELLRREGVLDPQPGGLGAAQGARWPPQPSRSPRSRAMERT